MTILFINFHLFESNIQRILNSDHSDKYFESIPTYIRSVFGARKGRSYSSAGGIVLIQIPDALYVHCVFSVDSYH